MDECVLDLTLNGDGGGTGSGQEWEPAGSTQARLRQPCCEGGSRGRLPLGEAGPWEAGDSLLQVEPGPGSGLAEQCVSTYCSRMYEDWKMRRHIAVSDEGLGPGSVTGSVRASIPAGKQESGLSPDFLLPSPTQLQTNAGALTLL